MADYRCEECDRSFNSEGSLFDHNKSKHPEIAKKTFFTPQKKRKIKKMSGWLIFFVVIAVVVWGITNLFSGVKTLPPTDMQGHAEINPPSHIMKEPMPIAMQKHMLEHADGEDGGRAGVVINYNCDDYECEENLIENLERFTEEHSFVYVAPFKNMDAKIALTRLGKIEVLEDFDEDKINNFILNK